VRGFRPAVTAGLKACTAIVVTLASLAPLAQSPADEIASLEQQRIEAQRAGRGLDRFYSPTYRGITALGQYEAIEQVRTRKSEPANARNDDVVIELHDKTAIVTATEGASETGARDRVLRIWTKDDTGAWTIAASQTTWIGMRAGVPPPVAALSNPPEPFVPRTPVEDALWKSQDALMRSFSDADPASYQMFSTANSLRMTTNGDAIARDQWLDTIGKRTKGPLAVVDEVRIAVYGDVGVVTLRGHEANPTRQSWVYLKQDGVWKLHLRYTSLIRG
jgi:hypothetical protein